LIVAANGLEKRRLGAHIQWMENFKTRLNPAGANMSGKAAVWNWELELDGEVIDSGEAKGAQANAYAAADEAKFAHLARKAKRK
jgi:hypothetical protein